jgi:hypothetical protein
VVEQHHKASHCSFDSKPMLPQYEIAVYEWTMVYGTISQHSATSSTSRAQSSNEKPLPLTSDFPSQEAASSGCGKKTLTDEGNCTPWPQVNHQVYTARVQSSDTSLPKGIALSDSS